MMSALNHKTANILFTKHEVHAVAKSPVVTLTTASLESQLNVLPYNLRMELSVIITPAHVSMDHALVCNCHDMCN